MARKQREDNQQGIADYSYTSQSSAVEMVDNSAELIDPAPMGGTAYEERAAMLADVPPIKQYRVVSDALVMNRGAFTLLRAGKIIDGANYDLEQLSTQGVRFEEY
jgi:hypothetical protein